MGNPKPSELIILCPVFNDGKAVTLLLDRVDRILEAHRLRAAVLLIDDGSTDPLPANLPEITGRGLWQVDVVRLRRNVGHQRAICLGLAHLDAQGLDRPVMIMDADGEDAPENIPKLWERFQAEHGRQVVFAARARRSEGILFRAGYLAFRMLHRVLTGLPVRVGNFSILPPAAVAALVTSSDLWSHYAAAVLHSRLPWTSIPTERAARLDGRSRMNVVSLVVHGLSAISVFSDRVGARLLLLCLTLALLAGGGIMAVAAVRLGTDLAIPGWATFTSGLLALMLLQSGLLAAFFSFLILHGRNRADFLPARDYVHFLGSRTRLFPSSGA